MASKKLSRRGFIAASAKTGIVLTAANMVSGHLLAHAADPYTPNMSFDRHRSPTLTMRWSR